MLRFRVCNQRQAKSILRSNARDQFLDLENLSVRKYQLGSGYWKEEFGNSSVNFGIMVGLEYKQFR